MYQQKIREQSNKVSTKAASARPVQNQGIHASYETAPVQGMFSSLKAAVFGNKVPRGVQEMKVLGGGYGVGYDEGRQRVVLYNGDGILAHVEIQTHGAEQNISLHTGTDSGEVGGQGHMTAMFPVALQVVSHYFSDYPGVDMAPALGAATKGLIGQLSRLRMRIQPPGPPSRFAAPRMFMASRFLETSDRLRDRRKQKERRGERARPEAQSWDSDAMLETAHELNALREMEAANPTGMTITGLSPDFNSQLVGAGSPLLDSGALAWHRSGDKNDQAMLQLSFPMAAVELFVQQM